MMNINQSELVVNGVVYVPKDNVKTAYASKDGKPFVIVRGDRSGVYFGWLESQNDKEVILLDARNVWYWSGAATIMQMSVEGVSNPNECKFTMPVAKLKITDCIQILECTEVAKTSLTSVKVWKQ